jgi:hypothetical protein
MRREWFRLLTLLALLSAAPALADAQVFIRGARPRAGSVEVSGGGLWTAGQSLPSSAAVLTGNPGAGDASFELFSADPSLEPSLGAIGTVAVYVTPRIAIEGGVQFARPKLTIALSDDFEDAPGLTASSTVTSYLFTGSVVYHFGRSTRNVPFVAAGAGHVRDVHTGNELVETGMEYHGRAGVKLWFGPRRTAGLRLEGGLSLRDGGFSFDEERRFVPTAAASFLYLF